PCRARTPCADLFLCSFFINELPTTELYSLSLHDALPIFAVGIVADEVVVPGQQVVPAAVAQHVQLARHEVVEGLAADFVVGSRQDRKSTRLNSSHVKISYAVFCLKKKKKKPEMQQGEAER